MGHRQIPKGLVPMPGDAVAPIPVIRQRQFIKGHPVTAAEHRRHLPQHRPIGALGQKPGHIDDAFVHLLLVLLPKGFPLEAKKEAIRAAHPTPLHLEPRPGAQASMANATKPRIEAEGIARRKEGGLKHSPTLNTKAVLRKFFGFSGALPRTAPSGSAHFHERHRLRHQRTSTTSVAQTPCFSAALPRRRAPARLLPWTPSNPPGV